MGRSTARSLASGPLDGADPRVHGHCTIRPVREAGVIDSPIGHGPNAHLAWVCDRPLEFPAAAVPFLDEGATEGQRLLYVADRTERELVSDLADLPGRDRLLRSGGLVTLPIGDPAAPIAHPHPEPRQAAHRELVDAALAAGFSGLRVAIDITGLVRDASALAAQARWERVVDTLVHETALCMLCGIDRSELGSGAAARLACLHPAAHASSELVPFRLYADGTGVALAGEADGMCADALALALAASPPGPVRFRVDVSQLEFIDGHALAILGQYARLMSDRGGTLVLTGARPLVRRLADLLDVEERLTFE
jgi:anti-anti-sigma factor